MADADSRSVRRAAGAALRGLRRRGTQLHRVGTAARGEPLRPGLAVEAFLAAMQARFELSQESAARQLGPALADWRDAVGCADPILVPANAQGPSAETALVPIPIPSWCAWLVDSGVLRLDGPPVIQGPRVVQPAWLVVIREVELSAIECFPIVLAARFGSGAASLQVHLALSPPFLSQEWRGSVCLRAAAHRVDRGQPAVRLWLGAPASPGAPAPTDGRRGESVVTWAVDPVGAPSDATGRTDWPSGWPRWVVLRALEGREPQAVWDLTALWRARLGTAPEASSGGADPAAPGNMRLAVDIGSTSTVVVEEDSAVSGSVGGKLLCESPRRSVLSGFRRLAGDARTAHRHGCSEQLLAPGGQLPTVLAAATPDALATLLAGDAAGAADQVWLPQAPPDAQGDAPDEWVRADRFKSPELLALSDWLTELPGESALDRARVSRRLLESYGYLLGRALAAAHGAPLVTPDGGRWRLRWPSLGSAEAVMTHPHGAWSTHGAEPFGRVFEGVGRELCRGLRAAWRSAEHRMVPDPAAANAARDQPQDGRHPIEAFVDFGGLTLQITVRVPTAAGRPAPFIGGSSMSYLLGGERLIDSAAYAAADRDAPAALREVYRATARRWRLLISRGGHLEPPESGLAEAVRNTILDAVFALVRRQVEGTLRRASPDLTALRGAGVRLYVLGEGWKLAALDAPDEHREDAMLRHLTAWLARRPLLPDASLQLQRMTKRRLCEGALRVRSETAVEEEALELQGVDSNAAGDLWKRWFGVVEPDGPAALDLVPARDDPWWRLLTGDAGREGSLLRVEQWFSVPESPFRTGLAGGRLAYDGRRSVLKQWLDVSGPSLVALRIHAALAQRSS
ncbi:MAG: hypothetical protein ACJ79H_18105 [Myxococcales bacterium]